MEILFLYFDEYNSKKTVSLLFLRRPLFVVFPSLKSNNKFIHGSLTNSRLRVYLDSYKCIDVVLCVIHRKLKREKTSIRKYGYKKRRNQRKIAEFICKVSAFECTVAS